LWGGGGEEEKRLSAFLAPFSYGARSKKKGGHRKKKGRGGVPRRRPAPVSGKRKEKGEGGEMGREDRTREVRHLSLP